MSNPRGTPESLGVIPLSDGEQSRTIRVRAPSWVFEQLKGKNALQIGELLAAALSRPQGKPS